MNTVNENVKDQRNVFKNVVQKNLHRYTPEKMKFKSVQSKEVEFKAGTDQIKAGDDNDMHSKISGKVKRQSRREKL